MGCPSVLRTVRHHPRFQGLFEVDITWGGKKSISLTFLLKGQRKNGETSRNKGKDREHWKLTVPLPQVMVYHGVATVLYFTAFVTNAATVDPLIYPRWYYNNLAAASVRHY